MFIQKYLKFWYRWIFELLALFLDYLLVTFINYSIILIHNQICEFKNGNPFQKRPIKRTV